MSNSHSMITIGVLALILQSPVFAKPPINPVTLQNIITQEKHCAAQQDTNRSQATNKEEDASASVTKTEKKYDCSYKEKKYRE